MLVSSILTFNSWAYSISLNKIVNIFKQWLCKSKINLFCLHFMIIDFVSRSKFKRAIFVPSRQFLNSKNCFKRMRLHEATLKNINKSNSHNYGINDILSAVGLSPPIYFMKLMPLCGYGNSDWSHNSIPPNRSLQSQVSQQTQ